MYRQGACETPRSGSRNGSVKARSFSMEDGVLLMRLEMTRVTRESKRDGASLAGSTPRGQAHERITTIRQGRRMA